MTTLKKRYAINILVMGALMGGLGGYAIGSYLPYSTINLGFGYTIS